MLGADAVVLARFVYDWDETGQLARARRWDFLPGRVPAFDPAAVPAWDLSYAYGAGGRTRITKKEALALLREVDRVTRVRVRAAA